MVKDFRFGVGLQAARRQQSVQDWARRAEDIGYDVMHMADHLYTTAPFPMMTAMAMATEKLRVGTFVLNAGFYRPALLARDVTSLRDLSGGRFDLGLGAGYVKEEFEQAELPYPTAGERVDMVASHHRAHERARGRRADPHRGQRRQAAHPRRAAGQHHRADRAAHPIIAGADPLADRIAFVREAAGDRFDELELNISVIAMPTDDSGVPDLTLARRFLPDLSDEEMLRHARGALGVADGHRRHDPRLTATTTASRYITVQQQHAEAFAKVIAELR